MTNADKYLTTDIGTFLIDLTYWEQTKHQETKFDKVNIKELRNFLQAPVQPTLTEDERVILRNLQPEITLIGRNGANELFIAIDSTNEFVDFYCYDHLFQFIKERRRI